MQSSILVTTYLAARTPGCHSGMPSSAPARACACALPCEPARMKFVNALMTVIGWIFAIAAILAMLGLGSVHLHFGPLDLRFPFRLRW